MKLLPKIVKFNDLNLRTHGIKNRSKIKFSKILITTHFQEYKLNS